MNNKKVKNYLLIMVCLFLFCLPSLPVLAIQPLTQEVGKAELIYPQIYWLEQNTNFSFNTRTYNESGYLYTNVSSICELNIYDQRGKHTIFTNMSYNNTVREWFYTVPGTTFSEVGFYSYIIYCYSTTEPIIGGAVSGSLDVTLSGRDFYMDSSSGLAVTIFVLFITSLLFWVGVSKRNLTNNDISNFVLKRSALIIAVFLMNLDTAIVASIAQKAFLEVTSELLMFTWLFSWGGYLLIIYLMFTTTIKVIKMWNINKKQRITGVEE